MGKYSPTSYLYKGEKTHEPSLNFRPAIMQLWVIQLLHSQRQAEREWGWCQCKLLHIYRLFYKLLGLVTRFFVSFIKVPVWLKTFFLKKHLPFCAWRWKFIKFAMNNHLIIAFHTEKFLRKIFCNDRNLPVVYQFYHRYFQFSHGYFS